jgi:hypothetical protein
LTHREFHFPEISRIYNVFHENGFDNKGFFLPIGRASREWLVLTNNKSSITKIFLEVLTLRRPLEQRKLKRQP